MTERINDFSIVDLVRDALEEASKNGADFHPDRVLIRFESMNPRVIERAAGGELMLKIVREHFGSCGDCVNQLGMKLILIKLQLELYNEFNEKANTYGG